MELGHGPSYLNGVTAPAGSWVDDISGATPVRHSYVDRWLGPRQTVVAAQPRQRAAMRARLLACVPETRGTRAPPMQATYCLLQAACGGVLLAYVAHRGLTEYMLVGSAVAGLLLAALPYVADGPMEARYAAARCFRARTCGSMRGLRAPRHTSMHTPQRPVRTGTWEPCHFAAPRAVHVRAALHGHVHACAIWRKQPHTCCCARAGQVRWVPSC